jgi:hypothetical protein
VESGLSCCSFTQGFPDDAPSQYKMIYDGIKANFHNDSMANMTEIDILANLNIRRQVGLLIGQFNSVDQVVSNVVKELMDELNLTEVQLFMFIIHNRTSWITLILNMIREVPDSLPYTREDRSNEELMETKNQFLDLLIEYCTSHRQDEFPEYDFLSTAIDESKRLRKEISFVRRTLQKAIDVLGRLGKELLESLDEDKIKGNVV